MGKLGKFDEAIKAYDKAIEIDPQHSNAWYNKGLALTKLNRQNEAIKAFEKANRNIWQSKKPLWQSNWNWS